MKKLLSIIISIIIMLSAVIALPTASAKQFTCGDFKYKILEDGTASITEYIGYDKKITDIKIPDKIDEYKVTKVSNYAFDYNKGDIVRPPQLNSLEFPDSVVTIGKHAINNCSFKIIKLGKNVKNISKSPFIGACNLTKIVVSKDNKYFVSKQGVLFTKDMSTLLKYPDKKTGKSYNIPKGVKTISNYAFTCNKYLDTVVFPKSLETIGRRAFSCANLKSINIPQNIVVIGEGAFIFCEKATKLIITPNSKLKINRAAFVGLAATSLQIPKVSGNKVFADCPKLKKIIISPKVKTLTYQEFYDCPKLKSVTIPKTVKKIGKLSIGYINNGWDGEPEKIEGFTINGAKGSAAEKYAKSNGFKFVALKK